MLAAGNVPEEGRTEKGESREGTRSSTTGSPPLDECSSVRGLNSFQENGRSTLLQHQYIQRVNLVLVIDAQVCTSIWCTADTVCMHHPAEQATTTGHLLAPKIGYTYIYTYLQHVGGWRQLTCSS